MPSRFSLKTASMEIRSLFAARILALLGIVLTVSACAAIEITDRSVGYNLAVENAANQLILLNAVRASKRYPMQFTAISTLRASPPVSTQLGFDLPFSGDVHTTLVKPQVTVSSGTGFDVGVLNTQDFYRGILTPLPASTLEYYLRQGWPQELLLHVFIREIRLQKEVVEQLNKDVQEKCNAPGANKVMCDSAKETVLAGRPCPAESDLVDGKTVRYVNEPFITCRFLQFQNLLRKLQVLVGEVRFTVVPTQSWVTTKYTASSKDGPSEELACQLIEEYRLFLPPSAGAKEPKSLNFGMSGTSGAPQAPSGAGAQPTGPGAGAQPTPKQCERQLPPAPKPADAKPASPKTVDVILRSPEAMIFYLGELIEVENRATEAYIPMVIEDSHANPVRKNLLVVKKGFPGIGSAIVSVTHDGDTYYIPRAGQDESMHVISLITQILSAQQKSNDLPITPTLRVTGQ